MSRPLLITDCDEVLLHMVVPFREWVDEARDIHFQLGEFGTTAMLRHKSSGAMVEPALMGELLDDFFATEMRRQYPIAGAMEALTKISEIADIAILTNIDEWAHQMRVDQLANLGVHFPVHWNQGPKGKPLGAIIEAYRPSVTVFVDDLSFHHRSVAKAAPNVWRLHMVGEPELAPLIPNSEYAHARIDTWAAALSWVMDKFAGEPACAADATLGKAAECRDVS